MNQEGKQFDCSIRTEGKETVFKMDDGREFRVVATTGHAALEAFLEWRKAQPTKAQRA